LQAATTRLQTDLEAATAEKARAEAQLAEYGARCNQSVKCIEDADLINKQNRDRVGREFSVTQGELGIVLTLAERPFNAQQPTVIAPGSLLKLDLLADYLKRLPNQILIETFGQGCGSAAACQSVTETWAQTLARHLEAQGVPMSRMTPVGRGAAGAASAAGRGRAAAAAPQVKVTIRNE
jgi:outer membrane protein OmpA-like peptidoglycan-associated protein